MTREYRLEDIKPDGLLHSRIYEFIYDAEKKILSINVGFVDLKEGGALVDCTITITDWSNVTASFTREGEAIDVISMQDFILKNHIGSAIYSIHSDGDNVFIKGHARDCLFSFKVGKPKIQITGEYDPD